jgi:ATP synthase protein I
MCADAKIGDVMKHKGNVMRNLMLITQLGISVMVPVFLCILAGYYINRFTGINAYKLAMATLHMNEREDRKREEEALQEKSKEPHAIVHKPKEPSRVRKHDNEENKEKEDV